MIKKLKQINEEQKEGLLEELRVVNLSKFVSEAVTAILDAKLRSSDINAAVQVQILLFYAYYKSCSIYSCGFEDTTLLQKHITSTGALLRWALSPWGINDHSFQRNRLHRSL